MTAQPDGVVFGGIDTHKDMHVAALLDGAGMVVGTAEFPTTRAGYRQLLGWMQAAGPIARVGVEGTGSYGAGICRQLTAAAVGVVEVNRPDRSQRRRRGKSDVLDAVAAAEAARTGQRIAIPKSRDGQVEALRMLRLTRASAVKARSEAWQQLDQLLVTAPEGLRDRLRELPKMELIRLCAGWRPNRRDAADPLVATRIGLKKLARRYLLLDEEIHDSDILLDGMVTELAPQLLAAFGIGTETAGQILVTVGDNPDRVHSEAAFAMLCGVAPLPASSGKTQRHRLNRGGDRQANRALHVIATTRKRWEPRTQAYLKKKTAQKHTEREATRCLKRHIAREVYYLLKPALTPLPVPPSRPASRRAG
ncbi:MAG TPA: IS110 family transposase, partial [Propionibacteriaceae bacterium]|nr:IS110 family transposase [Propionibacteriaceae bacterium]